MKGKKNEKKVFQYTKTEYKDVTLGVNGYEDNFIEKK